MEEIIQILFPNTINNTNYKYDLHNNIQISLFIHSLIKHRTILPNDNLPKLTITEFVKILNIILPKIHIDSKLYGTTNTTFMTFINCGRFYWSTNDFIKICNVFTTYAATFYVNNLMDKISNMPNNDENYDFIIKFFL